MFISENDIRRLLNKEMSPEQAQRRAETLQRAKEARIDSGIVIKPGVVRLEESGDT